MAAGDAPHPPVLRLAPMGNAASVPFGSPAVFHDLFISSPDAVIVTDKDGSILEANPRAEELFGYSRPELLGLSIDNLVPDRFRSHHAAHRGGYHAAPRTRQMGVGPDLCARRRDGSEFPVEIMLSPVVSGESRFVLAVVRDITERKRAADELREKEQFVHSLVEGVKEYAIFRLDPQGNVTSWNSGAERIKGY